MAGDGYRIFNVLVDGESVGAISHYTFENVRANHTIKVVFKATQPIADPDNTDVSSWLNTRDHTVYLDGFHRRLFRPRPADDPGPGGADVLQPTIGKERVYHRYVAQMFQMICGAPLLLSLGIIQGSLRRRISAQSGYRPGPIRSDRHTLCQRDARWNQPLLRRERG